MSEARKINWRAHLIGVSLGLMALTVDVAFPGQRSWTQIGLVTIAVAYLSVGDVWAQRREPGFCKGLLAAGILHLAIWTALWKFLPMHILNVVAIGGVEGVAVLILMYKTLNIRE